MQHAAFYIARRYLISKKRHNAINIVSGVSAAAVAVVTAALICVMSVMNGFGEAIEQMFSQLDPELRITPASGPISDSRKAVIASEMEDWLSTASGTTAFVSRSMIGASR